MVKWFKLFYQERMRVLILSLDKALFDGKGEGDTLKRFQAYGEYCQSLTAIVPVNKKTKPIFGKKVRVLPALGANNLLAYWVACWLTRKTIKSKKIDLVITNDAVLGTIAIWWRYFYKIKVQVNIFGLETIDKHWLKERWQNIFLKWIQEWAIKRADGLRTDNQREKKLLIEHYQIKPQKIVVIPIAPNKKSQRRFLEAKPNKSLRQKLLGNDRFLVLSVGSLVKAKDFPTLVKAAAIVVRTNPKVVFAIAGEGPQHTNIEKIIKDKQLEDNCKLLGSMAYGELPSLFASADLFVLASAHEGFPRVLMEAALTARPIVSTNIDGAEEIVKNGISGLLVSVKSPIRLAETIQTLLEDESLAKKYGRAAKQRAIQLLDFKKTAKAVIQSWEKLISET